jgi:subtilisin family serine protease
MKKSFMLILLLFMLFRLNAQEVYFYGDNGTKIYLETVDSLIMIKFDDEVDNMSAFSTLASLGVDTVINDALIKQRIILRYSSIKFGTKEISKNKGVKYANKSLIYSDGTIQIPNDKVLVQVKDGLDIESVLKKVLPNYDKLKRIGSNKQLYLIELGNGESIKVANELYESGYFEYAQPSFTRLNLTTNPLYTYQWGLNNIGQNGGTSGIDINAPEAWQITQGVNNIKIAVIDQGVDLDHPDLASNLLTGYDATDGGLGGVNGDCYGNDSHGTACAGIIVAIDNDEGIKGVAPNCRVVPIRVTYTSGLYEIWDEDWIVDAINYAWDAANSDILSCSWGGGSSSSAINSEINDALTYGRNNLGCVLVFASGNFNTSVQYPANSNYNILAVGTISPCGERKNPYSCDGEDWIRPILIPPGYDFLGGSNYGDQLDIMAPGVFIPTTDIQNTAGYNNTNPIHDNDFSNKSYTNWFNGTSAATPHVAGVAALILSANPFLTGQQVRNTIESTAQKVRTDLYTYSTVSGRSNGTWNNQMGYGLVNAYSSTLAIRIQISGPSMLCSSGGSYSISNVPSGASITWSSSTGIARTSAQGSNPCNFIATNSGTTGWIGATVTYEGITINLTPKSSIWLGGVPSPELYANNATLTGSDWYTVVLNTPDVYFCLVPDPAGSPIYPDTWEVEGDSYWYTNGSFLEFVPNVLGENIVAGYRHNTCGFNGTYFTIEVVSSKSGEVVEDIYFKLSPNPANEYVDIKLALPDEEKMVDSYRVDFVDSYSRNVKQVVLSGLENRVNIQDLHPGYYVVLLRYNGEVYSNKLILE